MNTLTISRGIILMVMTSILALFLVGRVGLYVSSKQIENIKLIAEDSLPCILTLGDAGRPTWNCAWASTRIW